MPYLNVKVGRELSGELSKQIADTLGHLTTSLLGKKRDLTSIAIESVADNNWFVAGVPVSSRQANTFYAEVHITEGTNTKDEKAAYIGEVYKAMQKILGNLHRASYVIIKEVRADSWGYGGRTQECRYIQGNSL